MDDTRPNLLNEALVTEILLLGREFRRLSLIDHGAGIVPGPVPDVYSASDRGFATYLEHRFGHSVVEQARLAGLRDN